MSRIETLLSKIEEAVRAGEIHRAQTMLAGLEPSRVPREAVAPLAALARRAGLARMALLFLHPYVRENKKRAQPAPTELAEYALTLNRLGAGKEALEIIRRPSVAGFAKQPFYEAMILFTMWEYEAALPRLREYVARCEEESYDWQIGLANLCSALIFSELLGEARSTIASLKRSAQSKGHRLLIAHCFELEAQLAVATRDWDGAEIALAQSDEALGSGEGMSRFFLRKWKAVAGVCRAPGDFQARQGIQALRAEATKLRHWESVRDCDLYLAFATGNETLASRVYFGTPNPRYRSNMSKLFGSLRVPQVFDVVLPGGKTSDEPLDLTTGVMGRDEMFRPGHVTFKLFESVAGDLYRPRRMGSLFFDVFGDTYFDPASSPGRLYQAVYRTNSLLQEKGFPGRVKNEESEYGLELDRPVALRFHAGESDALSWLGRLSQWCERREFSAKEAREALGVSNGTINKILREEMEAARVARFGSGKNVRYKIVA